MKRKSILCLAVFAVASTTALAQITEAGRQEIQALLTLKQNMPEDLRKLDSQLAWGTMKTRGLLPQWLADRVSEPGTDPVAVSISAPVTDALVQSINDVGGTVTGYSVNSGTVNVTIPGYAASRLASIPGVNFVATSPEKTTNSVAGPKNLSPIVRGQDPLSYRMELRRLSNVKNRQWNRDLPMLASNGFIASIFSWFADQASLLAVGALTSQGYITHRADYAKSLGYTGTGVKVGVLSDSARAARVAALIASGDLPANTIVLSGQEGPSNGSDEGTAMMEIISDMAPGAQLIFATAFTSASSFAANIIALQQAGCSIIVDDVSYFNEGVYQDGPIAQAVNTVTAAGVTYLSSAGNSGNKTRGTSGAWEGDFSNGGPVSGVVLTAEGQGSFHQFAPGQVTNRITSVSSNFVMLKWSDPLGASNNDYDLLILNSTGTTLKRWGASAQNGTQDPYEITGSGNSNIVANDLVVIVLYSGAPRALNFTSNRGQVAINTPGVVYGHNAAANTVTVAAVNWNAARRGTVPFIAGSSYPVETFSSDGPRRIFYNPNGTAITPGNVLFGTNGGSTLQKPDLTAADGVSTMTPGFNPFFGTSAAAPSAAGVAALVKQVRPNYTPAQVKAALRAGALDIMAAGTDRDSGVGITMASSAVGWALSHP